MTQSDFIIVKERKRTYVFPNGEVEIFGVHSIAVSKSGTHRIETNDSLKHIIPTGWLHIKIDVDQWTF